MLKVSPLFTDGAVLCRGKEIRIFGEAGGETVRCELRDEQDVLLAAAEAETVDGRFMAMLPPQQAGYNLCLTVQSGEDVFRALDVCVGEVYLAGGQSNMELELQNADEGPELIRTHVNPLVRYFNVPKRAYICEEADAAFEDSRWQAVGPGRAADMSAAAYFFAMKLQQKLEVPVGIIDCYWGGTSVTAWISREGLDRTAEGRRYVADYEEKARNKTMEQFLQEDGAWKAELHAWEEKVAAYEKTHPEATGADINREVGTCPWNPPVGPGSPYRPAALYDTMVERIVPETLTGILWYQGESDAGLTKQYDCLLMSLAEEWRSSFRDPMLPFLNVQLPMWIASGQEDSHTWPEIRLAQARVRDRLRNSGMICLLDQGEWDNLHPTNKRVVGERLCELAQKTVYGLGGETSPVATGKYTEKGMMTVAFSSDLRTSDGQEPALLELAGADGIYRPARAMLEGKILRLSAPDVPYPISVRYAWTDFAKVNLFGANGYPLEPFEM